MTTPEQIAWAAGVYEGEGTIIVTGDGATMRLALQMTDLDVLQRFQAVVGAGRIHTKSFQPDKTGPSGVVRQRKAMNALHVNGNMEVGRILLMFWPWLGHRRREQAEAVLNCVMETRAARGYRDLSDARRR